MVPFRDPRDGVFYWEVIDTDSSIPARIKIWDPQEFAPWVLLWCLMEYLRPKERKRDHIMALRP